MARVLAHPLRRWMRLVLPGLCLSASAIRAEGVPPPGFEQGNALYAAGKYAPAAAAYESAVRAGTYSANLFYDLGNTYDRLGQPGRSILNYRRALLLEPSHAEARANLAYVMSRLSGPTGAGHSWLAVKLDCPDIDLWTILAAAAGSLGWICLVLGSGSRGRRLTSAALCFAVCGAAAGTVWWLDDGVKNAGRAVVLTDRSRALYSPADSSKAVANLPVGSEVRVLSEQGAWVYAQLADGSRAWLAAASVEEVIPKRN
jgi:tetratricopeptide (TPR) repeat protein